MNNEGFIPVRYNVGGRSEIKNFNLLAVVEDLKKTNDFFDFSFDNYFEEALHKPYGRDVGVLYNENDYKKLKDSARAVLATMPDRDIIL